MKNEKTSEQLRNNLFYLCSLIEYIGRMTKNPRSVVVNAIGEKELRHIFVFADVYHCENIEKIATELIERHDIAVGQYDNTVNLGDISLPTFWDMGKVYSRLIGSIAEEGGMDPIKVLISVYDSWLALKIDNYRSSMYYENNSYLTCSYKAGHAL